MKVILNNLITWQKKIAVVLADRLHIRFKALIRLNLIALIIALLSFPIWYYWICTQSLTVHVKLTAPGVEVVKAYWDNPQTHPDRYEPIQVKPTDSKNWNIKIEALGEKNARSEGYEVAILDISTPEKQADWSEAKFEGNWEIRYSPDSPQNQAPIAHSKKPEFGLHPEEIQSVAVPIEGGELEIKLFGHGGAGKAKITVDNREQEIDLYAPEGFHEILKFPPLLPGDMRSRNYKLDAPIPWWSKLQFLADENDGEVKVQEVTVNESVILPNQNDEYILPYYPIFIRSVISSLVILILSQLGFFSVIQIRKRTSYQRFARSFLLTLPALLSSFIAQNEAPFYDFLFRGGIKVFLLNVCFGILFFYMPIFLLALGTLILPSPSRTIEKYLSKTDIEILRFFSGAAILMLLGFILGFVKLLIPSVTISIFISILYIYFLRFPNIFKNLGNWLLVKDKINSNIPIAKKKKLYRNTITFFSRSLNFLFAFFVLHTLLGRGIFIDLMSSDVQQLYFAYFAQVRRLKGIWIDSEVPIIADFLAGRGHGVHLFFTSFTNQYFIQIIGVMYFVAISILAYRVIVKFSNWCVKSKGYFFVLKIFPISGALFTLTSFIQATNMGKYHLETGALFLCLSFYGAHFLFLEGKQRQWLLLMMLPMVIALAIAVSQTTPIIFVLLSSSALLVCWVRGKSFSYPYIILIVASILFTIISLLINQIYIGIAEVNPLYLFIKFANLERFQQWSSIEQYVFLGLIHKTRPFERSLFEVFGYFFYSDKILNNIFSYLLGINCILSLCLFIITRSKDSQSKLKKNEKDFIPQKNLRIHFVAILFSLYPIGIFFMLFASQGSVMRMFSFVPFYSVVGLFGSILLLYSSILKLHSLVKTNNFSKIIILFLREISGSLLFCIFMGLYNKLPFHEVFVSSPYRSFLGQEGIIESISSNRGNYLKPFSKADFYRPLEFKKILPEGSRILPLNATVTIVPSQHTPLLPRGTIVHHYQSDVSRYYREIVWGTPSEAYEILRFLNIDFFYIEKDNIEFYAPGFSDAFSWKNLRKNFDIFYEDDRFIILTWRGEGKKPVERKTAFYIHGLREKAKISNGHYEHGWEAVLQMKKDLKEEKK